ncbi:uncharacterized protein [Spinacia oleracea]|uniref:Uncharacterized protein isoform X3 n=1 Tax=Spinacia oleracea TaxID=3562 RepID=A0ABM3RKJ7_SPIOL|nr:uncharacterized protein LOC110799374 isoform X3 [Spinacia oleracea]
MKIEHVEMDKSLVENCMMYIAAHELRRLLTRMDQIPLHTGGEPGCQWIHRLLTGHPNLCKEQLRLEKHIFINLVSILLERKLISDGRKVLESLVALSKDLVRPYQSLNEIPTKIANGAKYFPFFKDCVGALDGTHIDAIVGDKVGQPFRGRKGIKTWNVLASCSFDMLFTYVCVGFEGSAHDTTVLRHCLGSLEMGFHHPPPGKYYLVDSGYPNTIGYLSPYQGRGLRVHTPEFKNSPAPRGKLEHYNYRHSSLRGTVERIFGVLKNRWKVLRMMPKMDDAYQLAIIVATCTLHNFIRLHDLGIPISQVVENMEPRVDFNLIEKTRTKAMEVVRAKIAEEI